MASRGKRVWAAGLTPDAMWRVCGRSTRRPTRSTASFETDKGRRASPRPMTRSGDRRRGTRATIDRIVSATSAAPSPDPVRRPGRARRRAARSVWASARTGPSPASTPRSGRDRAALAAADALATSTRCPRKPIAADRRGAWVLTPAGGRSCASRASGSCGRSGAAVEVDPRRDPATVCGSSPVSTREPPRHRAHRSAHREGDRERRARHPLPARARAGARRAVGGSRRRHRRARRHLDGSPARHVAAPDPLELQEPTLSSVSATCSFGTQCVISRPSTSRGPLLPRLSRRCCSASPQPCDGTGLRCGRRRR